MQNWAELNETGRSLVQEAIANCETPMDLERAISAALTLEDGERAGFFAGLWTRLQE